MENLKKGNGGIQLYSGRVFYPLTPRVEDFTIMDVAHGLSGQGRWANHTKVPFYVTQHSVIMARIFIKLGMVQEAKEALMHEVEEALGFGDMPSPIKYLPDMAGYRKLAKRTQAIGLSKVGLTEISKIVKELDDRMKAAEAKVLCHTVPDWATATYTSDIIIKPYKTRERGKKEWLKTFKELFPNIDVMA